MSHGILTGCLTIRKAQVYIYSGKLVKNANTMANSTVHITTIQNKLFNTMSILKNIFIVTLFKEGIICICTSAYLPKYVYI